MSQESDPNTDVERVDRQSLDVAEQKRLELLRLFPEVRTEGGKIDFDRLKLTLGAAVDGKERYGLTWPGKAECFRTIQTPSTATLRPMRQESVNFDTTENMIIEGDNLEVLKLLQKAYLGKVKMIFIDPPYNTGNDFIYPDNYTESLQTYLEYTGQVDAEGKKFSTNTDTDGRFHSKWLTMMYPRLYLARNLLRDDGVIFISIDDNEVVNLRKICDEIFGEENFIGLFVINASPSAIDYGHIAKMHDYALFYARSIDDTETVPLAEQDKEFKYEDETGPFNIYPLYNGNVAFNPKTRPNLYYPFYLNPSSKIGEAFYELALEPRSGWVQVYPVVSRKDSIQRVWRWGKELSRQHLNKEIVGYKTEDGEYRVVQKSRHTGKVIRSLQLDKDVSTRRGTAEVEQLLGSKAFPFPKPTELIRRFVSVSTDTDGIVLDFFSGSGTTAHAVMKQNAQDGGKRRFILVQLPERTVHKDLPTIADIARERVRRVIKQLDETDAGRLDLGAPNAQDRGFRSFRLAESSFAQWDSMTPTDSTALGEQLQLHVDNLRSGRSDDDLLYEILLREGFPLTTPCETVPISTREAQSLADGALIICLSRNLDLEAIRAIADRGPQRVVCLDDGFAGSDQLKANAAQIFKAKGIVFRTV